MFFAENMLRIMTRKRRTWWFYFLHNKMLSEEVCVLPILIVNLSSMRTSDFISAIIFLTALHQTNINNMNIRHRQLNTFIIFSIHQYSFSFISADDRKWTNDDDGRKDERLNIKNQELLRRFYFEIEIWNRRKRSDRRSLKISVEYISPDSIAITPYRSKSYIE